MKRLGAMVIAVGLLALSGCNSSSEELAATPSPTTTPTLAKPVELDYLASVLVDDGVGRALVSDWTGQKVRVIDSTGDELWSADAFINDEGGGTEAYSAGDTVIVHDYSGTTTAYSWSDGSEVWSFEIPDSPSNCHLGEGFASQTTGTSPILGDDDLIILSYSGMLEDEGCDPTSEAGNAMVFALDPATGKEAWPGLSIGTDGETFGGTALHISPDRMTGVLSWQEGSDSAVSRISLEDGRHTSVPITKARAIDDTGVDHYDVYPTTDPAALLYLYGSEDPDDPMSSAVSRIAKLSMPEGLEVSDAATMTPIDEPGEVSLEDTFDPVCASELHFTSAGKPACLQTQLFASAVKYQGSNGSPDGWFADAPETAVDSFGFPGGPQSVPVDAGDRALLIVPGVDSAVMALDAATGETVWTAGKPAASPPESGMSPTWGGQGALPDLGLVGVTDSKKTSFFEADTGKLVDEHTAGEYAQLSSGHRFLVVADEETSTMWAVVDA